MSVSTAAARANRAVDTEGRTPEELREIVSHWGAELELAPAETIIEWAAATFGERFAITSSMGDAVLAHLASKVVPGIDVVFLDTGYHFIETIGTRDAVEATMPVNLLTITPVQSVAEQDAEYGKDLYRTDPDLCCALRKVKPWPTRSPPTTPGPPAFAARRRRTGSSHRSSAGTPSARRSRYRRWRDGPTSRSSDISRTTECS